MICLFAVAAYAREIRKRPKLKSSVQRLKEIVLVAGQNIAWLQASEGARQSYP